jgi:glycosyltransferase involved in cell wall biosynthesis
MKIAMLAWESLHSVAAGGVAAHVTELASALHRNGHNVCVFTRRGTGQSYYSRIDGVDYYRCSYPPHADFVEEVNNMCRSFVDHVFEVEDRFGPFDVVHAHDWLAANAMIWIKQGRSRKAVITIHSTEYGRCGNQFFGGPSERVRMQEHAGIKWADRVIAVSSATSGCIRPRRKRSRRSATASTRGGSTSSSSPSDPSAHGRLSSSAADSLCRKVPTFSSTRFQPCSRRIRTLASSSRVMETCEHRWSTTSAGWALENQHVLSDIVTVSSSSISFTKPTWFACPAAMSLLASSCWKLGAPANR